MVFHYYTIQSSPLLSALIVAETYKLMLLTRCQIPTYVSEPIKQQYNKKPSKILSVGNKFLNLTYFLNITKIASVKLEDFFKSATLEDCLGESLKSYQCDNHLH